MNKFFIIIFCLVSFLSHAHTNNHYSIITLPENFFATQVGNSRIFNNRGQVAGYVSSTLKRAAVWDKYSGLTVIEMDDFPSFSNALNDFSLAAVGCGVTKDNPNITRTLLWNVETNELKYGTIGTPTWINNENKILIIGNGTPNIWDTENDIISISPGNTKAINNEGRIISESIANITMSDFNTKGDIIGYKNPAMFPELFLFSEGHLMPIIIPGNSGGKAYLNDHDEVVTISWVKEKGKNVHRVVKWRKGEKPVIFSLQNIPEFDGWHSFTIYGFNNFGEILLNAENFEKRTQRLFLLMPLKS